MDTWATWGPSCLAAVCIHKLKLQSPNLAPTPTPNMGIDWRLSPAACQTACRSFENLQSGFGLISYAVLNSLWRPHHAILGEGAVSQCPPLLPVSWRAWAPAAPRSPARMRRERPGASPARPATRSVPSCRWSFDTVPHGLSPLLLLTLLLASAPWHAAAQGAMQARGQQRRTRWGAECRMHYTG